MNEHNFWKQAKSEKISYQIGNSYLNYIREPTYEIGRVGIFACGNY